MFCKEIVRKTAWALEAAAEGVAAAEAEVDILEIEVLIYFF